MSVSERRRGYHVRPVITDLSPLVRRLREIVAWDEPWDYEDDEADAESVPA